MAAAGPLPGCARNPRLRRTDPDMAGGSCESCVIEEDTPVISWNIWWAQSVGLGNWRGKSLATKPSKKDKTLQCTASSRGFEPAGRI